MIFDIQSYIYHFLDEFYKEMLIYLFTLLVIEIEIKPHIKTSISPKSYSINSSNY